MNRNRFVKELNSDISLTTDEREEIHVKSLNKYHWKTKCTASIEEMAELQQQLTKQIRGYGDRIGLLEEMADVYICLGYLRSIFNISQEELDKAMNIKLKRESERLNN